MVQLFYHHPRQREDKKLTLTSQGVTKRAGRRKDGSTAQNSSSGGKPQVKKAVFESTKKKEVGVTDLTLISKISNEAINENLKKRFEHAEIYVWTLLAMARQTSADYVIRHILVMSWFP